MSQPLQLAFQGLLNGSSDHTCNGSTHFPGPDHFSIAVSPSYFQNFIQTVRGPCGTIVICSIWKKKLGKINMVYLMVFNLYVYKRQWSLVPGFCSSFTSREAIAYLLRTVFSVGKVSKVQLDTRKRWCHRPHTFLQQNLQRMGLKLPKVESELLDNCKIVLYAQFLESIICGLKQGSDKFTQIEKSIVTFSLQKLFKLHSTVCTVSTPYLQYLQTW